jgi:chemotaxis family two-component system sensor kinase Cph1
MLFRRNSAVGELTPPLSQALEVLPGALLALDDRAVVRYASPRVSLLLGYSREEVLGQPVARLFDPGALDRVAALLDRSRASGAPEHSELPGWTRDRTPVLLEVGVVWRASPSPGSSTMYLRDLAEREALVEALAQRAADLARSNRDLEQFAYVASHDLQEPLRMVGSYTQLLSQRYQGKLDAEADEYLGYAHDGVVRMRELIDDLLAFARVGTRAEPFVRLHTEDVVDDALDNLSAAIEGQHATVTRGELPDVVGDAGQLRQLFQNLVANALKFRGPASPKVAVEAVRNGGEWTFSVRDNGIGIPPEFQDKIFGMFQRLHGRGEYPGTGIGLAICKRVVERHGGRIWVESTGVAGEGTRFCFTLPVEGSVGPRPTAPARPVPQTEVAPRAQTLIEERLRELI